MGQEVIKGKFEIPPSPNVIDVLGSSGYSLATAIADIIDNSITAKANRIDLIFNINGNDDDYVLIMDNGEGMNYKKIHSAAVIANVSKNSERKDGDLGRYSLGMKSASTSFCKKLYIISKAKDSDVNTVLINFKEIVDSGNWNAYDVNYPEFENMIGSSGTIILWKDLKIFNSDEVKDRKLINRKIGQVETHLSHIFSDYIKNNQISIYINRSTESIPYWDPFMLKLDNTKSIDIEEITYKNEKIKITTYILPVVSSLNDADRIEMTGYGLGDQQGFYIYRNNRIISEGGWLGLKGMSIDNKANQARIRVDITNKLDSAFKVNFMKNSIEIPDELKDDFLRIAKKAKRASLDNYNYRNFPQFKKKKKNIDSIPVWNTTSNNDGIYLTINEDHPLIKELTNDIDKRTKNKLFNLLSKTIPVAKVQSNNIQEKEYSKEELIQLLEDTYNKLIEQGKTMDEAIKEIARIEPFNEDKYRDYIVNFMLDKKEGTR